MMPTIEIPIDLDDKPVLFSELFFSQNKNTIEI